LVERRDVVNAEARGLTARHAPVPVSGLGLCPYHLPALGVSCPTGGVAGPPSSRLLALILRPALVAWPARVRGVGDCAAAMGAETGEHYHRPPIGRGAGFGAITYLPSRHG
jgi:hypothetical protein